MIRAEMAVRWHQIQASYAISRAVGFADGNWLEDPRKSHGLLSLAVPQGMPAAHPITLTSRTLRPILEVGKE